MGKFALLIGVGDYQSLELQNLAAAIPDVRAIEKVLIDPAIADFARDDVIVLLNPEPQQMREAIDYLFADRKKDDLILLYFSGHGVTNDSGNFYFTSAITQKNRLDSTAIPATFVHGLMEGSKSQRQVVILDSCFSGAFAKDMKAKGEAVNLQPQLGGKGRAVLTSSSATEYSFEQKEAALSVYTQYVVEGLRTGIADRDENGWISIDELHEFAQGKVREVAPAMQPKIYAVEEGYKIRFAKAPIGDPKLAYRKEVEKLAKDRNGFISPILKRGLIQKFRGQLTDVETSGILDEVLKPYCEFEEKLQQFSLAVKEFLELPREQQLPEDLGYFQQALGLRNEDIVHLLKDVAVVSPFLSVSSLETFKEEAEQNEQNSSFKLSADDYFTQGLEKYNLGDSQGAIVDYTKAIEIKSDYTNAYHQRGVARHSFGDPQGAIDDYAKIYCIQGFACHDLCDYKGAVKKYTEAIRLKSNYAEAYNFRGVSRVSLCDYLGAGKDYMEAIRLKPDFAVAYNNLGLLWVQVDAKEYAIRAIENYTNAIELKPDYADAYVNRGIVHSFLSDDKCAIEDYSRAIEINSDNSNAYYNRAVSYKALNENNKAVVDYQQAADLYQKSGSTKKYLVVRARIRELQ